MQATEVGLSQGLEELRALWLEKSHVDLLVGSEGFVAQLAVSKGATTAVLEVNAAQAEIPVLSRAILDHEDLALAWRMVEGRLEVQKQRLLLRCFGVLVLGVVADVTVGVWDKRRLVVLGRGVSERQAEMVNLLLELQMLLLKLIGVLSSGVLVALHAEDLVLQLLDIFDVSCDKPVFILLELNLVRIVLQLQPRDGSVLVDHDTAQLEDLVTEPQALLPFAETSLVPVADLLTIRALALLASLASISCGSIRKSAHSTWISCQLRFQESSAQE